MSFFSADLNDVIKAFRKGNNINKCQDCYPFCNPLEYAMRQGNLHVFKYLIRKKADINNRVCDNKTPLWYSLLGDSVYQTEFIEILLNNGAKKTLYNKYSLLTFAIEKCKDVKLFDCLLKAGLDVNEMDKRRCTPLIAAVRIQNIKMVKSLLDYGAEFTAQSALLEAIITEQKEIVELLTERDTDVNFQSITGFTLLTQATNAGSLEIVEILIKNGADVNLLDVQGNSPLINSIRSVQLDMVHLLVENGANVHQDDGPGNLPLTEALHTKNFPIIKFLIENGAKWNNIRDKNGYSPLTQSVQERNFDMLKFFLDKKEDVNELDNNQKTALLLAVETENVRFAKMLTERGALVNDFIEKIEQLANNNDDWKKFFKELDAEKRILEDCKTIDQQI